MSRLLSVCHWGLTAVAALRANTPPIIKKCYSYIVDLAPDMPRGLQIKPTNGYRPQRAKNYIAGLSWQYHKSVKVT